MPPMVTCGKKWNVGSDDFVIPSLLAILVRLVGIGLIVGVLIYLFVGHVDCPVSEDAPPLLYGSLFAFIALEFVVVLNETIICSVSSRGNIYDRFNENENRRKNLPYWLALRVILYFIELPIVILCAVVVFTPKSYGAGALQCEAYHDGPLVFAEVIICLFLVTLFVYAAGFLIYVDPLGCCCAPSILKDTKVIEDLGERGGKSAMSEDDMKYFKSCKVYKVNRNHKGYGRYIRGLRNLFCCLDAGGKRSRITAMQDLALALHTIFSTKKEEDKLVASDILSGMVLISHDQKKKKRACEACNDGATRCPCLIKDFKEVICERLQLTSQTPPNYDLETPHREFNMDNVDERMLFEDLVHYMHYAMGVYGWPLHIFDNLCCGFCQLCTVTCCVCNYSCRNKRYNVDFFKDDMCLSGIGTIRLRSQIPENRILHVSYHNDIWEIPFSVCIDRDRRSLVVTVRGTLSIKDALTDLSVNMVPIDDEHRVHDLKQEDPDKLEYQQFIHNGAYNTAKEILKTLEGVLEKHLTGSGEYTDYTLVITGHSLGAGVASVLALLLRPKYKDLRCYAFSPPGCVFSFPLAHYSREFITTVVLGNDIIPRVTFRSLFYLKRQVLELLKKCRVHKMKVLCLPRWVDHYFPRCLRNCLFGKQELPELDLSDILKELKEVCVKREEELKAKQSSKWTLASKKITSIKQIVDARKFSRAWKKKTLDKDALHHFVEGIEKGEIVPSFPPGKVLHIEIRKGAKPWCLGYFIPNRMKVHHIPGEDLCVIKIDRGMIDDHLPNNVLNSLKRCQQQLIVSRGYDHPWDKESETWKRREKIHEELIKRRRETACVAQPQSQSESSRPHCESVSENGMGHWKQIELQAVVEHHGNNVEHSNNAETQQMAANTLV